MASLTQSKTDLKTVGDVSTRTLMPKPRTLFGPGFLYELPRKLAVVVGDVENKVFDNTMGGHKAEVWTAPEWYTAEPGGMMTTRSGNPELDVRNPIFSHKNQTIHKI